MKTKEKEMAIDGSGLFFFKSDVAIDRKFEILQWYKSLSDKEQSYIRTLRGEAAEEANFFTSCE